MKARYVMAAVITAAIVTACSVQEESAQAEPEFPVRTLTVRESEIAIPVRTSGTLASKTEMRLSFKTSGIVEAVYAEEGQTVREGVLLARLDLAEIDSQVEQARAGFEKAERDLKRVERLYEDEVTTLEQLQDARTAFDIARSQLNVAAFNLEHSSIRAPAAGRILRRFVEEGELVGSGMPVYQFASGTQDWVVRVGVTDVDLLRLRLGDRAELAFDAHPDRSFNGQVTEVGETANPVNGLFEVEIRLDPSGTRLVSGFIAAVDILPSRRQRSIVVPIEALAAADGMAGSVFVLEETQARVRRRSVQVLHIFDDRVALSGGITEGQSVVVEGAEYLVDGSPVRVVDGTGE